MNLYYKFEKGNIHTHIHTQTHTHTHTHIFNVFNVYEKSQHTVENTLQYKKLQRIQDVSLPELK